MHVHRSCKLTPGQGRLLVEKSWLEPGFHFLFWAVLLRWESPAVLQPFTWLWASFEPKSSWIVWTWSCRHRCEADGGNMAHSESADSKPHSPCPLAFQLSLDPGRPGHLLSLWCTLSRSNAWNCYSFVVFTLREIPSCSRRGGKLTLRCLHMCWAERGSLSAGMRFPVDIGVSSIKGQTFISSKLIFFKSI